MPKSNFVTRADDGGRFDDSGRWKFHVSPRYHDLWDVRDWESVLAKNDTRTDLALFPADLRFDQPRSRE